MKPKINKRITIYFTAIVLCLAILLSSCGKKVESLTMPDDAKKVAAETAASLIETNTDPGLSSIGGEWLVMGVYYSGYEPPEGYYDRYYDNVRAAVKSSKGVLSEDHYTEYERVILCLDLLGKDFTDVEGYDLTLPLDDFEKISEQGANAASFALIASHAGGFTLENEDPYIKLIIEESDTPTIMGEAALSDYIAMAIEALSYYTGRADVDSFLEESINSLSQAQKEDGAMNNCEATAECIIALVQMGIDPLTDERFIKKGKTLADGLMTFYLGDGKFFHDEELMEADQLPTEKALLGLDALLMSAEGRKLYE